MSVCIYIGPTTTAHIGLYNNLLHFISIKSVSEWLSLNNTREPYMHTASFGRRDGSSQHKSPHQARAFRRGLDVVTCAEISPSRRT